LTGARPRDAVERPLAAIVSLRASHCLGPGAPSDKPTGNAFIEAFNGRLRSICLNQHWFLTLADAAETMAAWLSLYNEDRPQAPDRVAQSRCRRQPVTVTEGRTLHPPPVQGVGLEQTSSGLPMHAVTA